MTRQPWLGIIGRANYRFIVSPHDLSWGQGVGSPLARPYELWVFYPGQAGAQFMQQYAQAGLKDSIPICSVFTVDALTLPQIKEQALGQVHQLPSRHAAALNELSGLPVAQTDGH